MGASKWSVSSLLEQNSHLLRQTSKFRNGFGHNIEVGTDKNYYSAVLYQALIGFALQNSMRAAYSWEQSYVLELQPVLSRILDRYDERLPSLHTFCDQLRRGREFPEFVDQRRRYIRAFHKMYEQIDAVLLAIVLLELDSEVGVGHMQMIATYEEIEHGVTYAQLYGGDDAEDLRQLVATTERAMVVWSPIVDTEALQARPLCMVNAVKAMSWVFGPTDR